MAWGLSARARTVRTWTSPGPGHLFFRKLNQGDPESLKRPQSCDQATARQGLEPAPLLPGPQPWVRIHAESRADWESCLQGRERSSPTCLRQVHNEPSPGLPIAWDQSHFCRGEKHPPGEHRALAGLSFRQHIGSEDSRCGSLLGNIVCLLETLPFKDSRRKCSRGPQDTVLLQEETVLFDRFFSLKHP